MLAIIICDTRPKIAVNAKYLRRCQALFDAGIFPAKDEVEDEPDMMLVVEGMSKPLHYNDIDPDDAALVASVMVGVHSSAATFVSFTDEDGEDNLIPADKVMLLESLHYEDEFDEETPEEVEAVPPARKSIVARARKPSAK